MHRMHRQRQGSAAGACSVSVQQYMWAHVHAHAADWVGAVAGCRGRHGELDGVADCRRRYEEQGLQAVK
eukprot:366443-Chlamydomonas_euryale.AAC.3